MIPEVVNRVAAGPERAIKDLINLQKVTIHKSTNFQIMIPYLCSLSRCLIIASKQRARTNGRVREGLGLHEAESSDVFTVLTGLFNHPSRLLPLAISVIDSECHESD
jgi:hypothetical protein